MNLFPLSTNETLFLVILSSLVLTLLTVPSIIFVSQQRQLYDDQHLHRKAHNTGISRLGGIGIFCSFMITILMMIPASPDLNIRYLLIACIIIFAMGIKDDIVSVNTRTKFGCQFLAAALLVIPGEVKLTGLYGLMGVYEINPTAQIVLSILFIMMLINAFNLIDGINCLAAGIGVLAALSFAGLFWLISEFTLAAVSLSLAGALIGFIPYNVNSARLFMGDTGAMLIGLILSVICIEFINAAGQLKGLLSIPASAIALAFAILIVPVFDTLRVFILRIFNGRSPFHADRKHIHHLLVNTGLSHEQSVLILSGFNGLAILTVFVLDTLGNNWILLVLLFQAFIFVHLVRFFAITKKLEKIPTPNFQLSEIDAQQVRAGGVSSPSPGKEFQRVEV